MPLIRLQKNISQVGFEVFGGFLNLMSVNHCITLLFFLHS